MAQPVCPATVRAADRTKTQEHVPEFTILNVPKFRAYPDLDGTRPDALVVVHFAKKLVIGGGTSCAGEMKGPVFTVLNSLLPLQRLLSTRCSANTGWTGGSFGTGSRLRLPHTRALLRAAMEGKLAEIPMRRDPVFGLEMPTAFPGVLAEILEPRKTWADPSVYDAQAFRLADLFQKGFERFAGVASAIGRTAQRSRCGVRVGQGFEDAAVAVGVDAHPYHGRAGSSHGVLKRLL